MNLGPYLKQQREARGIGLRALARQVGVSPGYLCGVEAERRPPSPAVLQRLSRALGENNEALLMRAGKIPQDVLSALQEQPDLLPQVRAVLSK